MEGKSRAGGEDEEGVGESRQEGDWVGREDGWRGEGVRGEQPGEEGELRGVEGGDGVQQQLAAGA